MIEEIDKKTLFDNINYLIKKENRKIGELEAAVGVSIGYISRTSKEDGPKPGIEFIVNVASELHVSIDTLLKTHMSALTPTEQYLVSFLDKLKQDTEQDKLFWEKESAAELNQLSASENGNVGHPLYSWYPFGNTGGLHEVTRYMFDSQLFHSRTVINGDCFNLRLKNDSHLYLMNIKKFLPPAGDPNSVAKEAWIVVQGEKHFLCSNQGNQELSGRVNRLYEVVTENLKHPKVKKDVKYIIDSFMKDDIADDREMVAEEDIPFN